MWTLLALIIKYIFLNWLSFPGLGRLFDIHDGINIDRGSGGGIKWGLNYLLVLQFCLVTRFLFIISAELHLNGSLDLLMLIPKRHHRTIDSMRNWRCITVTILHLWLLTLQLTIRFLMPIPILLIKLGQTLWALRTTTAPLHTKLLCLLSRLLFRTTLASLIIHHWRRDVITLLLQIPIFQNLGCLFGAKWWRVNTWLKRYRIQRNLMTLYLIYWIHLLIIML